MSPWALMKVPGLIVTDEVVLLLKKVAVAIENETEAWAVFAGMLSASFVLLSQKRPPGLVMSPCAVGFLAEMAVSAVPKLAGTALPVVPVMAAFSTVPCVSEPVKVWVGVIELGIWTTGKLLPGASSMPKVGLAGLVSYCGNDIPAPVAAFSE